MKNICIAVFATLVSLAGGAQAQAPYPAQPVKLVVPWPAGGGTDAVSRHVASAMALQIKQQVVVDNRPGANGMLGTEAVSRAQPNGYTLGIASVETHAINPHVYKKVGYNVQKDFTPVAWVGQFPYAMAVRPGLEVRDIAGLVALAKAQPGKLSYASAGVGGSNHLGALLFAKRSGIEMNHVPYRGNAPAMTDVMGGQINMMLDIISTASTYINSNKVRPIAVTSPQRNASLPNVPTFAESGIEGLKGFDVGGWYGVYGPKGMSPELTAKMNKAINAALAQPELKAKYKELGYDEWIGSPQTLAERAAKERTMWSTVTQGIVVD